MEDAVGTGDHIFHRIDGDVPLEKAEAVPTVQLVQSTPPQLAVVVIRERVDSDHTLTSVEEAARWEPMKPPQPVTS